MKIDGDCGRSQNSTDGYFVLCEKPGCGEGGMGDGELHCSSNLVPMAIRGLLARDSISASLSVAEPALWGRPGSCLGSRLRFSTSQDVKVAAFFGATPPDRAQAQGSRGPISPTGVARDS